MDQLTRDIVTYVRQVRFAGLGHDTVHECKRHLIDTFAAFVAALDTDMFVRVSGIAQLQTAAWPASIWGTDIRTTPELAAFANGTLLRCRDLNDTYVGLSRGHPSDVLAAILAIAEARQASGEAVIEAMVVAYDLYCSFIDSIEVNKRGWDQPTYGVIACAAGVAKILGLDDEAMAHAIALALVPNMALAQTRSGELSQWKNCAGANASRNAVFAAQLAEVGLTGPSAVFEGVGGLFDAIGRFDWALPTADGPHRVAQTHLKSRPVCYHGQSCVEAALLLRASIPIEDIEFIAVETYHTALLMMANDPSRWLPRTADTADHSMPFAVATALVHGDMTTESYAPDRLDDPRIQRMMQRVRVSVAEDIDARYPNASAVRLTTTLRDGNTVVHAVDFHLGHHQNPLPDAAVENKLRTALARLDGQVSADAWVDRLWSFDSIDDVSAGLLQNPAFVLRSGLQ